MNNPIFGTMELAGTWRFFGGTYETKELAEKAINRRIAKRWQLPMKVSRIFRRPEAACEWLTMPIGPSPK